MDPQSESPQGQDNSFDTALATDIDQASARSDSTAVSQDPLILPSTIYPTSPCYTFRYKFKRKVDDKSPSYFIDALRTSFQGGVLPDGWHICIHPEGMPYFYQQPSTSWPIRVITDQWMYEQDTAERIQGFLSDIQMCVAEHNLPMPPDSDLVLELQLHKEEWLCGYYFVYHPTKVIYWLEETQLEYQSETFSEEVRGDVTGLQVGTVLEAEYWSYWDHFPNVQEVTDDVHDYAVDVITSAMTDVIASRDTTVVYSHEKLKNMLDVIQLSRGCKTSNWHIGRFLRLIVYDRIRNFYGGYGARISRSQRVLKVDEPEIRSKFLSLVSPFLFFIPHAQLERVEPLVIDRNVVLMHWDKFFRELQAEWNQTMMLATIMLAVNCAFLAIPIFEQSIASTSNDTHSTPSQIASYLSLVASLFGFILSMVMYRQQTAWAPSTPADILNIIYSDTKEEGPKHRLGHLVLIWSLPHALTTWSVIAFLVAFLVMCFANTLTITKVLVATTTAFLSFLIAYYLFRFGSGRSLRKHVLWLCLSSIFARMAKSLRRIYRGTIRRIQMFVARVKSQTSSPC